MVMLIVAFVDPPELLAQILYVTGEVWRIVGMPQIDPFVTPNVNPAGSAGLISQETISPGPVSIASAGKSGLAVLLVSVKFSGLYDKVGS